MSISLRQTLAQLASHTHAYDGPSFGLASYQSFLSYPSQYANVLVAFRNPDEPPPGLVQTGPPNYSS
jgi:hypothetical protein